MTDYSFYTKNCFCPRCFNPTGVPSFEGDYIIYHCYDCNWQTEKSEFYKIGKKLIKEIESHLK